MRKLLTFFFILISVLLWGQSPPVINSISPSTTFATDTVIITGSGFSAVPSNLQVWFGQVLGSIVSSSDFSIKVVVPPQARYSNVEIVNLSNRLSTKVTGKFHPYFSGNTFNPALMVAQTSISNANQLYDLCSCDLNLDGKPDIAATKFDGATDVLILKNQSTVGTTSFTQQNAVVGVFTEEIVCGDLNGDGKPELVASRSGGAAGGQRNAVYILPNTSSGATISFAASVGRFFPPGITGHARFVTIRDLNMDGKPEIIVSNSFNNDLYIFINESSGGTLNINPTPIRIPVAGATNLYGLEVQDMDGDGKPEIVLTQFQLANIFILKNQSTTTISFAAPVVQALQGAFNKLISADFNEDGKMDLAASDWSAGKLAIWTNTSSGGSFSFGPQITLDTDLKPDGIDVGDIDGDQDIDIVVASRNTNFVNVFLNSGNNTSLAFSAKQQITTSKNQRNIVMADLDGDAKPELAVTSYNLSNQFSIDIFRNKNCFVPALLTQSPLSICPGQTLPLESVPGFGVTFDWKNGATTIQSSANSNVNIMATGSYTVTAISESNACNNVSPAISVINGTGTIPADPLITTNAPVCTGQNLQLSTTPVSGATYTWNGPNNFSSSSTSSSTNINGITVAGAGEYTLQITSGFCKSNVKSRVIDIVNIDGFLVSSTSITNSTCQGTPLSLSTNSFNGFTYQWIRNGADVSGQTTSNLSVTQSGDYKVRVAYPSIGGCSKESSIVTVKVLNPPTIAFSTSSALCVTKDIVFSSSASVFDLPNGGIPVYAWTFGDNGTGAVAGPTHVFATAQAFNVTLRGSYLGVAGCTATSNQSITINNPVIPGITSSLSEICPDEETVLTVGGGTFSNFTWNTGATWNPDTVNVAGSFTVTTTDANGCKADTTEIITSKPVPTINVTASEIFVNSGQPAQLQASGSVTFESYSWTPTETLDNPAIANPIATPLATTEYTVVGFVTGQCSVEDSITITVNGDVKFPNVFSPNGDSRNDTWIIPGSETMADCTLSIFDKSGVRVLEQMANESPWNGTHEGKPVPPGTYFYMIYCPNNNPITGNILVAR